MQIWKSNLALCPLPGFWNDINCGYPNAFICQRHNSSINATVTPTVPSVPGGCKEGWNFYNNKVLRKLVVVLVLINTESDSANLSAQR